MNARRIREDMQIVRVRSDYQVTIPGDENDGSVNYITTTGTREQFTDSLAEMYIERNHVDCGQKLRETGLAASIAPDLADDAAMCNQVLPGPDRVL